MTVGEGQIGGREGKVASLDELLEVLQTYDAVMLKLQASHERLEAEVVRLREQLEQKNKELELKKRLAALGEMAAGIAHEIRNPLGGIQLYASTLAHEVSDRPLAADLVRKISNGVKGLNTLVSDMLAFTRDLNLNKYDVSVYDLVESAVEMAKPTLLQHGVEVRMGAELEGMTARMDGKLMQRVVVNLLSNSAEAIGERRETEQVKHEAGRIQIAARRVGERLEMVVEDNGPGVPEAVQEHLFEPFVSSSQGREHLGLGLFLAASLLDMYDAKVRYEKRSGGGACFVLELPATRYTEAYQYHWFQGGATE